MNEMHSLEKHQKPAIQPITRSKSSLLQCKCACGGTPGLDGECAECRKKRLSLQLDALSTQHLSHIPPIVPQVLPTPDRSLEPATRALIEPRFSHNFSQLQVYPHTPEALKTVHTAAISGGIYQQVANQARIVTPGSQHQKVKAIPTDKIDLVATPEEESIEQDQLEEPQTDEEAESTDQGPPEEPQTEEEPQTNEPRLKEQIDFQTVFSEASPPGGLIGKSFCPAPAAAPTRFSTRKSTAAQIAAMTACNWGITSPDPLKVTTRTCKDGGSWRLRVRRVSSTIRTFSRQLPGQREPTTANSTSANFCTQVTELDNLGNCPGSWYMLDAVKAHEAVHVLEWKTSFGSDWPAQKAIIEGLSVPAAGATKNRKAATTSLRSSAAFLNALRTNNASGNYPAFWGIPDPNVNTDAAERVIVSPRIKAICVNARNRGWAPGGCPVCAANGIV